MRSLKLFVLLFTVAVLGPLPSSAAQTVPVAQNITLKQALRQEANAYKRSWVTQSRVISRDGKIKIRRLQLQIDREAHQNPGQKAALRQQYLAEAAKINKETQAQLDQTRADLLDAHNYNVEQIKRSYGVIP